MSNVARVAGQAANTLAKPLEVDEVFSVDLWNGTGSANHNITTGVDIAGEGGVTWIKSRTNAEGNNLYYNDGGTSRYVKTDSNAASVTPSDYSSTYGLYQWTNTGFTLGQTFGGENTSGQKYVGWSFRKAPKFFDMVTYTGDGVAGRTISHNLGSVPGCIMVKRTNSANSWNVYHRGIASDAETDYLTLDLTSAAIDSSGKWNDTAPTSSVFTVGPDSTVNANGGTYVAYLFAHNDGDGGFGPNGNADIIKCGSYTGNGSATGPEIDLGFEPQWVLTKRTNSASSWQLVDVMRGMSSAYYRVFPDTTAAEDYESDGVTPTATGFKLTGVQAQHNASGGTYIYIAIRRPTAVPTSATEVFAVAAKTGASGNVGTYSSGFPVDMAFHKVITSSLNPYQIGSRLTQGKSMNTTDTSAEVTQSDQQYDYMDGWSSETSASSTKYSWMWKRAPKYFDVVAYTGNGTAGRTVSHNLGVVPEMMWVKNRTSGSDNWPVYHSGVGNGYLFLNTTGAYNSSVFAWNNTDPTAESFTVHSNSQVNGSGFTYIAYLFATLAGISKVGSYTGNGSSQTIDCGFSAGARFVLIKKTSGTGSWLVYDTERGIVAGNDSQLYLDGTFAADSYDNIDPDNSGFIATGATNTSGETYIFYAIA